MVFKSYKFLFNQSLFHESFLKHTNFEWGLRNRLLYKKSNEKKVTLHY